MAIKNYCLEHLHTKPLLTEQKIMNLENLHSAHVSYIYGTIKNP